MKRVTFLAIAAVMTFFVTSCSKDGADTMSPDNSISGAAVSFTFDKPIGVFTTYADIAYGDEWTIAFLDIYTFDDAGVYQGKLGKDTHYTTSVNGNTTTVAMKQAWVDANIGNKLNFYFVANDDDATNAPHINEANFTNEATFKAQATNALQEKGATGKYINIGTPLLFSGVSDQISITGGKVSHAVTLKRREARFDIVNQIAARFTINSILISDARQKGYVFADAGLGKSYADFSTVSMEAINGSFTYETIGTENIDRSVFYLYPTKLNGTKITIKGSLDGNAEQAYEVISTADIEANKRYKLICDHGSTIDDEVVFHLIAADYDEGSSIDVAPALEDVTIGTISSPLYVDGVIRVDENSGGTITIPVNSVYGTTASIHVITGGDLTYSTNFDIFLTGTTSTYASYGLIDTYTATLPTTPAPGVGPFRIEVTFTSKVDATKSASLAFVRDNQTDILRYDPTLGLNLDNVGTPLYFKFGSLIGTDANKENGDEFDASDVLYVPAGFSSNGGLQAMKDLIDDKTGADAWSLVPVADYDNYPTFPAQDENKGIGDPCLLAKKTGANIGDYRMPTGKPYEDFIYGSHAITANGEFLGVYSSMGQLYPAGGNRHTTTGAVERLGTNGFFRTTTPNTVGTSTYLLYFSETGVNVNNYSGRHSGFMIRCVSK